MEKLESYVLSLQQRAVWYNIQKGYAQNIQLVIEYNGKVDWEKFCSSVKNIIEDNNTYKLSFKLAANATEPIQTIHKEGCVLLEKHCIEDLKTVDNILQEKLTTVIDIEAGPLLTVSLFYTSNEQANLIAFTSSLLCADSWGISLLASRILSSYKGLNESLDSSIDYLQFSEWQNQLLESEDIEEGKKYWKNKLSFKKHKAPLLFEKINIVKALQVESLSFQLDIELTKKLYDSKLEESLLASCWYLTLWKLNRETNFTIGHVNHCRTFEPLYQTLGNFSKVLPLYVDISSDLLISDFIQKYEIEMSLLDTHKEALKIDVDYQQYINENLSYQFEYIEHNLYANPFDVKIIKLISYNLPLKLRLQINKVNQSYIIYIYYDKNSFTVKEVEYLFNAWTSALKNAVQHENYKTVHNVELLNDQYKEIVSNFSYLENADKVQNSSVIELFSKQVLSNSQKIAVVDEKHTISYEELDRKSTLLAKYLLQNECTAEYVHIGIFCTENTAMILSMLGILKAGGAYIPIDPGDSKKRIEHIIKDSNIQYILTESALVDIISVYKNVLPINIDALDFENISFLNTPLPIRLPETSAYIIYTSGTSGLPKGVVIKDSSLINYIHWLNKELNVSHTDQSLLLSSYAFDLGYTSLWGTILTGGTLHLLRREAIQEMDFLIDYIICNKISFIKTTPSFFQVLIQSAQVKKLSQSNLKLIILGGEAINVNDIELLHKIKADVTVVNHYGPTETTIGTIAHKIDFSKFNEYKQLPVIGKPISGNQVYILDKEGNYIAPGQIGEICISGKGLAKEYLNLPNLTSEKFQVHPKIGKKLYYTGDLGSWLPNGTILYLGRKDNQVKIRGYRVEPNEVELTISQYPDIKQAIIVIKNNDLYNKELIAYIISEKTLDTEKVRFSLKDFLPDYMIPADIIQLKEIPLTANYKVDYKALLQPNEVKNKSQQNYTKPRTAEEENILKIWEEVLNKESIGIDDDFFSLGGHSLKAIQMVNRLHKELNVKINLKDIFTHTTIRALTKLTNSNKKEFQRIEPIGEQEYYELSHSQKRIWLTSQRRSSKNIYNVPQHCLFKGNLNKEYLSKAFIQLITRHESLRTLFKNIDGKIVQKIIPSKEINFSITDIVCKDQIEINNLINKEATEPFDIENNIGIRAKLVKINHDEHLLLFTLHHIVSDGWSRNIIYKELLHFYESNYYNKKPALQPLKIQYKDYANWHNHSYNEQEKYWAEILREQMPINNFPLDYKRPKQLTFDGDAKFIRIDFSDVDRIKAIANKYNTTLHNLFLAVYGLLLSDYCQQDQLVIGTISSGRNHLDVEDIVGTFINYLPLKIDVNKDATFLEYLKDLDKNLTTAYQYQDYPFDLMVERFYVNKDTSRNPIFDTMIIFHNEEELKYEQELPGGVRTLNYKEVNGVVASKLDFKLDITTKKDGILIRLEYNRNLFQESSMQVFLERFSKLLFKVVLSPEHSIEKLSILLPEEKKKLKDKQKKESLAISPSLNIVASFTAEPLEEYLGWWLSEFNQPYEINFGAYHQVFQELISLQREENLSNTNVYIILNRFEDYIQGNEEDQIFMTLELVQNKLIDTIKELAKTKILAMVFFPIDENCYSNKKVINYISQLNNTCFNLLKDIENVYLIDLRNYKTICYEVSIFDPLRYKSAHIPFTQEFFYVLSYHLNRLLWAIKGALCKVIAFDCDNTLWEGICGEDKIEDIKIREGYKELQRYALQKYNEGFLLVLLSKNNEEDVWNVFENHPEMVLKKEHFIRWKINWENKSENIRLLAKELNLGLNSFAFIDDNPIECQEMMQENPEVLTLELPDNHYHFKAFLYHIIAFDKLKISKEDTLRNEMYQAEKARDEYRQKINLEEFFHSLNLKMSFKKAIASEIERVSQLTIRTNQFNLNGLKKTKQEIEDLISHDNIDCYVIGVRDRFGDYGLIGSIILEKEKDKILLHNFLLSCRILGRGIELAVMKTLKSLCENYKIGYIEAKFVETNKNKPFKDFLVKNKWSIKNVLDSDTIIYQIKAQDIHQDIEYVQIYFNQELPLKSEINVLEKASRVPEFIFDHVGIAVRNMADTKNTLEELGFEWSKPVYDSLQNCNLSMGTQPNYYNVELVESIDKESPINNMLNNRGTVPYHICFRVKNYQDALKFLLDNNFHYEIIKEAQPAILFNNLKVLFIYQKDIGLIELIEDENLNKNSFNNLNISHASILQVISKDVARTIYFYKLFGFQNLSPSSPLLKNDKSINIEILDAQLLSINSDSVLFRSIGPYRLVFNNIFKGKQSINIKNDYLLIEDSINSSYQQAWVWDKHLYNENNLFHKEVYKALEFCDINNFNKYKQENVKQRISNAFYEEPRNKFETTLAAIFREVLKIDKIGINDDFFELGGHSLKATQVLSRIYNEFNMEISLTTFFEKSTVKLIAELVTLENKSLLQEFSTMEDNGESHNNEIII